MGIDLVFDSTINNVFVYILANARRELRIATANIENIRLKVEGEIYSFAEILRTIARKGVEIKIIASDPCIRRYSVYKELADTVHFRFCYRMHAKMVIADARMAYTGSANITGAGVGIKSERKRNFEVGVFIENKPTVERIIRYFDAVWHGDFCEECFYRRFTSPEYRRCEYERFPCPGIEKL